MPNLYCNFYHLCCSSLGQKRINGDHHPHQKVLCMHSGHDRFSGSLHHNDQVPAQYNMPLSYAFPNTEVVYHNGKDSWKGCHGACTQPSTISHPPQHNIQ
uniref:Uncharacterized protein n=1 Tax=Opuntia streptacantha TaxID=393608 RepID=A0A7C9EFS2_OPUST